MSRPVITIYQSNGFESSPKRTRFSSTEAIDVMQRLTTAIS
jgi:hypothetical protein